MTNQEGLFCIVGSSAYSVNVNEEIPVPRLFQEIAADFDSLTPLDFDYTKSAPHDWDRLERLCNELKDLNDAAQCAPVVFRTMERLEGVDLGSPGPLVHTLENWPGEYERFLAESIRRRPTPLAIWMVNRILNTKPANAGDWLNLLRSVENQPDASSAAKSSARHFLKYQAKA